MKTRKNTFEERAAELKTRLESEAAEKTLGETWLTLKQAAARWGFSPQTTRRHFMNVEGVRTVNNRLEISESAIYREIRSHTQMPSPST